MSYFFLEAFEHVYKNRVEEYERMGTAVDKKIEETEPGMLIHAQSKVSEDECGVKTALAGYSLIAGRLPAGYARFFRMG